MQESLTGRCMDIHDWDQRYRLAARPEEDFEAAPTVLLVETAEPLRPGKALDLACGTGRNALWLAEHGWKVTAVDGAPSAVEILLQRASERGVKVHARCADLEKGQYRIASSAWDLIALCYYLQRDLFAPAKDGVVPGGILLAIAHLTEPGEEATAHRLRPGELQRYFGDWEILHYYEGAPHDAAHRRRVSEIVARRPVTEYRG
jgi:tellurite methyltransferase